MGSNNFNQKENNNETIDELAQRHLRNESHITSDEELKNAKVFLTENVKADEEKLSEVHSTSIKTPLTG